MDEASPGKIKVAELTEGGGERAQSRSLPNLSGDRIAKCRHHGSGELLQPEDDSRNMEAG